MLQYAKAHACGNDFLIVEIGTDRMPATQQRQLAIALCARTTGVGADGVEFLQWTGERSGRIHLRNADGSLAEISGNGTRCVAAWMAHRKAASAGTVLTIETDAGVRQCTVETRDGVRMQLISKMGVPVVRQSTVTLDEEGVLVEGAVVLTGNPHFVVRVDDETFRVAGVDWQSIGRAICFHPDFPEQTNVEFLHVREQGEIEIRIFERGVGPTSSSGTGTCATAAAAIALHGCGRLLQVHAPGGSQRVHWPADDEEIELTGPAVLIATGQTWIETMLTDMSNSAPEGIAGDVA
jgi:diaminopimelate epimerase